MMNLLKKNLYKVVLLVFLLLSLVLTYVVSIVFPSLIFFNLIPLATLLGIGSTIFLSEIFPIKNIFTFLVIALFLGLFINTVVIFFVGMTGFSIGLQFFMYYIPIIFFLNMGLFFWKGKEESIKSYVKNFKLELIDIIWLVVFTLLFVLLTSACLESFTPSWDSFTYWALDSKYIFEHSSFRDNNFLLLVNNYLSFFPIQINYVYLLYGRIVEQSAGLLSLTYAFIGVSLISSYLIDIKKSSIKKSLLYLGCVAAIYTFFVTHYVLISIYADLFLSIVVLIYALVLFNKKYTIKNYWKRFLILILLSLTLYFTKTHYLVLSLFLLMFYFLFDFKILYKNFKEIIKTPWFVISILLLTVYLLFVRKFALSVSNEGDFVSSVTSKILIDGSIFTGLKSVIKQLLSRSPLFALSIFVYTTLSVFVKRGLNWHDVVKILFIGILMGFAMSLYVLNILNISDLSMLRYLGLIFFVIPLLFIGILPSLDIEIRWQKILIIFAILIVPLLVVFQVYKETLFDLKFTPHSGSYSAFGYTYNKLGINRYFYPQEEYYNLSKEVLKIIPRNSDLMVLDYVDEQNQVANTFPPGLFIRYYLSDNNLGGPYSCVPDSCYGYLLNMKPDYLLVYSYGDYWDECKGVLEKDKTYLIKLDKSGLFQNNGSCVASETNIVSTF